MEAVDHGEKRDPDGGIRVGIGIFRTAAARCRNDSP
jgi:hypothetical protein